MCLDDLKDEGKGVLLPRTTCRAKASCQYIWRIEMTIGLCSFRQLKLKADGEGTRHSNQLILMVIVLLSHYDVPSAEIKSKSLCGVLFCSCKTLLC